MNEQLPIHARSGADIEFQLRRWLPVLAAVVLAVYAGYWVGSNNWGALWRLLWLGIFVFVAFSMQEQGWILIPMFWMASGSIFAFPLPLSWRDLAILLALSAYAAHRSMVRPAPVSMQRAVFLLLLLNVAWVALMWIRKPVGFRIFGSEMMGARFYFNIFMAAIAVWVLVRLPQSPRNLLRIPHYVFAGTWPGTVGSLLTFLVPAMTGLVLSVYGDAPVYVESGVEVRRFDAFRFAGMTAALLLASHCDPLKLFQPFRPYLYLLLLTLAGVAISGYRTAIIVVLAYIGLSMVLRRNWRQLILSSGIATLLLGALIFGQGRLYSLPLPVQRSLCFLPGKWSEVALRDAAGTAEGRFAWWRDIIRYRLIGNWLLGDGIGVRTAEAATVSEVSRYNYAEAIFFYGAYHNGPLTTIRCVGLVGLTLLYALMLLDIKYALRCLRQCRGTSLEPLAFFVAIPIIWFPIHFTLVFGSFEFDMPQVIFQTGLLLLLLRMLDEHPQLLAPQPVSA